MSNLINPLLCPNYEDYEPINCAAGASHYPDMWKIERILDKKMRKEGVWRSSVLPGRIDLSIPLSQVAAKRIGRVLAKIASDEVIYITEDGRKIYKVQGR